MQSKLTTLFALMLLILTACTEELKITPYSYTQVFTGESKKGWSIRNVQFLQEGRATETFGLNDCVQDDVYVFYANLEKSYEIVEGRTKCAAEDPTTILSDVWRFSQATATMTILFPLLTAEQALPFVVLEAEESRLSLAYYFEDGSSYRFNFRSVSIE